MLKYSYNGVVLPALPDWDKTLCPYAAIVESGVGTGIYSLWVTSEKLYLTDDYYSDETMLEVDAYLMLYNFDTGSWSIVGDHKGGIEAVRLLWTDYDILNDDGSVFFEATDPVRVSGIDLKSWLYGYLLGICGKPLPLTGGKKEPVAWMYGKCYEPLPDIYKVYTPELQKTHPHAVIFVTGYASDSGGSYNLYLVDRPFLITGGIDEFDPDAACIRFRLLSDKSYAEQIMAGYMVWEYIDSCTVGEMEYVPNLIFAKWTNTDIKSSGPVLVAASEPVPVYE